MGKRVRVERAAAQMERHPAAAFAASVGHAVNGVVHIIIGMIAIGIAFGVGGSADQGGAMRAIDGTPLGSVGLWAAGIALYALAFHSAAEAVSEFRREAWPALRVAGRGVAYVTVGTVAVVYASGGTADGEATTESVSAQLLQSTWGSWLLVIVGAAVFSVGVGLIVGGFRKTFLQDVNATGRLRRTVTALGVTGYIAKGVAVGIIGVLFVLAVINRDPGQTGGLDGALKKLTEFQYGPVLLVVIAAGLIAFGVFCFARARTTAGKGRRT